MVLAHVAVNEGSGIPVGDIAGAFAEKVGADTDRIITPRYTGFLLRKRMRLKTLHSHGLYSIPPIRTDDD